MKPGLTADRVAHHAWEGYGCPSGLGSAVSRPSANGVRLSRASENQVLEARAPLSIQKQARETHREREGRSLYLMSDEAPAMETGRGIALMHQGHSTLPGPKMQPL